MTTPNLDLLRIEIAQLLASGAEPARVEDIYIGKGAQSAGIYQRALQEWALLPKDVKEGGVTFRSGVKSAGCRRSVAGFREFVIWGGAAP
jgi:hypothetical protein